MVQYRTANSSSNRTRATDPVDQIINDFGAITRSSKDCSLPPRLQVLSTFCAHQFPCDWFLSNKSQMWNLKGRRRSIEESMKHRNSTTTSPLVVMVTFLFGMMCGRCIPGRSSHYKLRITSGSIHRLADTAVRNTSHTDANNQPITKQQLIEPFDVPNLAGFSVATLLPGQRVYSHDHRSMHEFFFILEGKVLFTINGKETLVEKGTMVHVTPYELHQLDAPFDSSVIMLVSGITVEDR